MKKFLTIAAVLAVSVFSRPAFAAVESYTFDNPHTQILFFVNHLGFSTSHGEFLGYDGHFTFDTDHPENSAVEIAIKTDSLDMNDEKWDEHMKSADFFNVEKFPEMTFKSTGIAVTGENTADITGDLTLLGVTKPVTLHVTHNKSGKHPFGDKYISGFSATASLKRSDFGMNYGLPVIGDEVDLHIEVEGVRQDAAAAVEPAGQ